MNSETAQRIAFALSRPAPTITSRAPATPASRTSSRLANAVVVKVAEPAPAPTTNRRSRSAVPAPKVLRIRRDPAVAAAELEAQRLAGIEAKRVADEAARQTAAAEAIARAAREAADARKAEEARVAEQKADAEKERKAQADREIAEAAERKERELQDARNAFAMAVRMAPEAFFAQAWDGKCSRQWFLDNISRGDMEWVGKTKAMFDAAVKDYRQKEALAAGNAKKEFEVFVGEIPADVFPHIVLGSSWSPRRTTRDQLVELARVGTSAQEMADIRTAVAKAIVLRDQALRDAEEEKERKKLDPKSKYFDRDAYLRANAGKPVQQPAGPPPSKAELARLGRKINHEPEPIVKDTSPSGSGSVKSKVAREDAPKDVRAKPTERELLNDRIRALTDSPKIVTNVYRGKVTRWRWETVEAMLAVSASDKEANIGLAEFVGRCEKAKHNGR